MTSVIVAPGTQALATSILAKYEIAAQVTRSVLQQADGVPFYVEIQSASRVAMPVKESKMEPPDLCDVLNLETGELQVLILNKVLKSELLRAFPDDSYVGKKFAIVRAKAKDEDKRYKTYRILELRERADSVLESAGKGVIDGTTSESLDHAKKASKKV